MIAITYGFPALCFLVCSDPQRCDTGAQDQVSCRLREDNLAFELLDQQFAAQGGCHAPVQLPDLCRVERISRAERFCKSANVSPARANT